MCLAQYVKNMGQGHSKDKCPVGDTSIPVRAAGVEFFLLRPITNRSDVAEVEEVSEPEFTHHVDIPFGVFCSFTRGIEVGFIFNSRKTHTRNITDMNTWSTSGMVIHTSRKWSFVYHEAEVSHDTGDVNTSIGAVPTLELITFFLNISESDPLMCRHFEPFNNGVRIHAHIFPITQPKVPSALIRTLIIQHYIMPKP